jgi:hypothetical protein
MVDEPFPQEVISLSNAKIRHLSSGGSFTVAISGFQQIVSLSSFTNKKMAIATVGDLLKLVN